MSKPPRIPGYYWRASGSGYELRHSRKDGDPDKDHYVAFLNGPSFSQMQAIHSGQALTERATEKIKQRTAVSE